MSTGDTAQYILFLATASRREFSEPGLSLLREPGYGTMKVYFTRQHSTKHGRDTSCARRVEVTIFAASCPAGCPGQLEKK